MSTNWTGMTITADQLRDILEKHALWACGERGGERANLQSADLQSAKDADLVIARTRILPEGDLIGWKRCKDGVIVKLSIPADAKRSHAFGRKCRAEYVHVLEVIGSDVGLSLYDGLTSYRICEEVRPEKWDEDWTNECSDGIHFYLSRIEAENYA